MAKNFQNGRHRTAGPYKKPFKQQSNYMFNASQIPDNPGFLDFNNPTPPIPMAGGSNAMVLPQNAQKKKNKNKQKNKPMPQQENTAGNRNNWNKNKNIVQQFGGMNNGGGGVGGGNMNGPNARFNNGVGGGMQRGFNPAVGPNRGRHMMMPPRGPPMPPPPHGFQPPMIPPIPPMGRVPPPAVLPPPMGQHPHFVRRNGRGGPMPPLPMPMPMIPPRMPRGMGMPPMPFNGIGKIKKPNTKMTKKIVKGKSTIKTLKNLVNQYPIEKPWVTAAIRAEYDKKIDIENRLKGNKDDDLFAQYKVQRDKFVTMYETAREEYLKKEADAVKAKDANQRNNKTAIKDTNSKEAIPNK